MIAFALKRCDYEYICTQPLQHDIKMADYYILNMQRKGWNDLPL